MRLLVIGFGDKGGDCSARVDCPVDDSFLHDRDGWRHSLEAEVPADMFVDEMEKRGIRIQCALP